MCYVHIIIVIVELCNKPFYDVYIMLLICYITDFPTLLLEVSQEKVWEMLLEKVLQQNKLVQTFGYMVIAYDKC